MICGGEATALDCILFRHDHRHIVGEIQVLGTESVVIGKTVFHRMHPQPPQLREKAVRIADPGHGMYRLSSELMAFRDLTVVTYAANRVGIERHGEFARCRQSRRHDIIHTAQSAQWFAQRTGRQAVPISEAAYTVDHRDLDIAGESIMLQSVIGDDDVAVRMLNQGFSRGDPVRRHRHWAPAPRGDEHRLVADNNGITVGPDLLGPASGRTAVSARDDTGIVTGLAQLSHQSDNKWCFSGAANGDITYYNDRYTHPPRAQNPDPVQGRDEA